MPDGRCSDCESVIQKGTPSISIRKSIRWLPDFPSEPTSTLVLTSRSSHFVDIRVLKPTSSDEPDPEEPTDAILPLSRLDWAFAGTAQVTVPSDEGQPTHCVWTHDVDSKSDSPPIDEGYMYQQPDGTTLEKGQMVNPATGQMTDYEEVWADGDTSVLLKSDWGHRRAFVLKSGGAGGIGEDGLKFQGLAVRVAGWYQGFVKNDGVLGLERWKWVAEENTWKRCFRMGEGYIPGPFQLFSPHMHKGSVLIHKDWYWHVVEDMRW